MIDLTLGFANKAGYSTSAQTEFTRTALPCNTRTLPLAPAANSWDACRHAVTDAGFAGSQVGSLTPRAAMVDSNVAPAFRPAHCAAAVSPLRIPDQNTASFVFVFSPVLPGALVPDWSGRLSLALYWAGSRPGYSLTLSTCPPCRYAIVLPSTSTVGDAGAAPPNAMIAVISRPDTPACAGFRKLSRAFPQKPIPL